MLTCQYCQSTSEEGPFCFCCGAELDPFVHPVETANTEFRSAETVGVDHALSEGLMVNHYRISGVLGEGGFGVTYVCFDTVLLRRVAVKELFLEGATRDGTIVVVPTKISRQWREAVQRFVEEGRAIARLTSKPGVVAIHEVFAANNTAYLVMELLEGESLDHRIEQQSRLSEREVVDLAKCLCTTLQTLHDEGLLHRDIKPDNVFIVPGRGPILIDFGAARAFGPATASLTQIISPTYAPLEQYSSLGVFGPPTDLYALGATLYEAITGEPPASAPDRVSGQPLPNPSQVAAVSKATSRAIMAALSINSADRPQNAFELLAMFEGDEGAPRTRTSTSNALRTSAFGTITTVCGTGQEGAFREGDIASSTRTGRPWRICVGGRGELHISYPAEARVLSVTAEGVIANVAGTGEEGFSGDGGPATTARFRAPTALAKDSLGNIYIADELEHRVRRLSRQGILTTIAGTGELAAFHDFGDGGLATSARLWEPHGLACDAEDYLYVAEGLRGTVRRVSPDGIISTVAGTGEQGYSGDGGLAVRAQLCSANGLACDTRGNLFVADSVCHCVRKISPDGIITTVAGTGRPGYSGDGGPAVTAELMAPSDVNCVPDGSIYVLDSVCHCVRKISPGGIISTVAGTGRPGYSGDGGPAVTAQLNGPTGLASDELGRLYIADRLNCRVRMVMTD
jgi:serine/threonine protein kinase